MSNFSSLYAFGLGIGTRNAKGEWLEVYFPTPLLNPPDALIQQLAPLLGYTEGNHWITVEGAAKDALSRLNDETIQTLVRSPKPLIAVFLGQDLPPEGVPDSYLKLHLLSHRQIKPRGTDLTGIFRVLPNVAWTSDGPVDPEELPARQLAARIEGRTLKVHALDKFPPMLDYVVPSGVRIADGARVRLGAYLGSGTTVMQEGFINFNAGTEGPNMVEGRVSSSVWVGAGSDLGGGCSTMGILSGGNATPLSVGKSCLLGANAGLGIPLGDGCTIEAGLYLTAGTKVQVLNRTGETVKTVKARDLAGKPHLLFRRNSLTGTIECLPTQHAIELNADLHA